MNLTIAAPELRVTESGTTVTFRGTGPDGDFSVKVAHGLRSDAIPPPTALGDAAVALFLLPALKLGIPLEVRSPVSGRLLDTLPILQQIFCTWYPETFAAPVAVISYNSGAPTPAYPPPAVRRGCFFSGGVDSYHAVLKYRSRLDQLIFVHGFDIPLDNDSLRQEVSAHIQSSAADLGLPVVEVETDVRQFSDKYVHWGSHFCGAAMAAISHLLSPWIGRVVVPASMSYLDMQPFGTHIYTDERWSTERMVIRHEGMEARRLDKIRAITQHETVLNHLRVCWRNHGNRYNCGHCEKCLRTMANLRALGKLAEAKTFPTTLDLQALAGIDVDHPVIVPFLNETLKEAMERGDEPLANAVRTCLASCQATLLARELTPLRDHLGQDTVWKEKAVPRFRDEILASCTATDPEWTRQEIIRHASKRPDEIFQMLWKQQKGWLVKQYYRHRLDRLNPFRRENDGRQEKRPAPTDRPS